MKGGLVGGRPWPLAAVAGEGKRAVDGGPLPLHLEPGRWAVMEVPRAPMPGHGRAK